MPVVWFTGLPGSGKSTLCCAVERQLQERGIVTQVLDGDAVRKRLCPDLGYSRADRCESLRRISYVAGLLARNGIAVLIAAISPYRDVREEIRASHDGFIEVFVNAPLEVCEARDPKGLYRLARQGMIEHFTGLSDLYEAPMHPDAECRTDRETIDESCEKVMRVILLQAALQAAGSDPHSEWRRI
jgi:adenylylsulfate kinase